MRRYYYRSILASWFEGFVSWKQSGAGGDYSDQAQLLQHFDRFLVAETVIAPADIDAEVLGKYLATTAHLAPRGRSNRVSVVWQALRYAIRHGVECPPLPERPRYPNRTIVRPHIYSTSEIARLLRASLALGPAGSLRPFTFSTLFGLLITTGIRIAEVLALNLGDVDRAAEMLTVRRGKFGKSRRVPLHPTTVQALERYRRRRLRWCAPRASDGAFFVSLKGTRLAHPTVRSAFRAALRAADVRRSDGGYPRLHDLRHAFAVRRVVAWYRAGVDVNQRLQALSTYLGHLSVNYTLAYLQPNECMLREAATRFAASCPLPTPTTARSQP